MRYLKKSFNSKKTGSKILDDILQGYREDRYAEDHFYEFLRNEFLAARTEIDTAETSRAE